MLLLPADVIKSEYDHKQKRTRHWLSVRENKYAESDPDPRYSRPQIKTVHSHRQVPVSELTATLVQSYAENYRSRPSHSFFLNAQSNRPFSTESLTSAFKQISGSMPPRVLNDLRQRTGKESISPQDLRHTSAVVRLHQLLEKDDSMDEGRLQKLRTFFGWSKNSQMPLRYARAVFEDRLAGVWNNAFDDRVTLLRSLYENVRMNRSATSFEPISPSAGADDPVDHVIACLPPLPSVIRYYDEFDDTARSIPNPTDTDKFEVWINGTRTHINFGRLESAATVIY